MRRQCANASSRSPHFSQPAQLFLHPEDAALVRQYLNHELDGGWFASIRSWNEAGAGSRCGNGQMDATLATRWRAYCTVAGTNM